MSKTNGVFKKDNSCMNCGKTGHSHRNCKEPIVSYGVMLLSLNIKEELILSLANHLNSCENQNILDDTNINKGINIEDLNDLEFFCILKDCIKFLLIQRKHTLGFLEFMRGKYNVDNVDGIIFLFEQMTPEEIHKIKTLTFDELWLYVWGNNPIKDAVKGYHQYEYNTSKEKFYKLRNDTENQLNLSFYTDNVKTIWSTPEWGFPKGRRNKDETDRNCALREFCEETGCSLDDVVFLDCINPIEELLTGTNGIPYKHVYYLAFAKTSIDFKIDPNVPSQCDEIGDIGYFSYEECLDKIRPHHINRKKIVTNTYIHVLNRLIEKVKV